MGNRSYDPNISIGQKFGKLTVIDIVKDKRNTYVCKCECGKIDVLVASRLKQRKSCGCYEKENLKIISKSALTHGKTNTRMYGIWCGMKDRCFNPNVCQWEYYGGRGITVCDEWKHDFQAFYDWSMAHGYEEHLSIDRIDVNGNYEPSNCRWITLDEQKRNRRDTVYIMEDGVKVPISVICEKYGIYKTFVWRKVKAGWELPEILMRWEENQARKV